MLEKSGCLLSISSRPSVPSKAGAPSEQTQFAPSGGSVSDSCPRLMIITECQNSKYQAMCV